MQNRVDEIVKLAGSKSWRHCPGRENPADLPSRGVSPLQFADNTLWRSGPLWMMDRGDVPVFSPDDVPPDCTTEMKVMNKLISHSLLNPGSTPRIGGVMRCQDFGTLSRLLRVTAHVVKFLRALLKAINKGNNASSYSESTDAERLWLIDS